MIKINYPENRKEFHKKYIDELKITDKMRNRFFKLMSKNPLNRFGINLLDYILLAPFEELLKITLSYPLSRSEKKAIQLFFNYDYKSKNKFQSKIKSFFEKELKIKTCYFCNIDFVNSFNDRDDYHDFSDFIKRAEKRDLLKLRGIGNKRADKIIAERSDIERSQLIKSLISKNNSINLEDKYNHFTLDHVLDKASHPLIALSLYNFVPSCYSCNSKFKGSKQFINNDSMSSLSPTSEKFSFNDDVQFKLYFYNDKNISTVNNINDYVLDFNYLKHQNEYEKYIDTFKLKGRYIFHKNEVIRLINKKERYSQSQLNEISNIINISSEQVKKDIFGKELFEGNMEDMSMTKFKQDIAKNINLIS
jgi:hypothetical protein